MHKAHVQRCMHRYSCPHTHLRAYNSLTEGVLWALSTASPGPSGEPRKPGVGGAQVPRGSCWPTLLIELLSTTPKVPNFLGRLQPKADSLQSPQPYSDGNRYFHFTDKDAEAQRAEEQSQASSAGFLGAGLLAARPSTPHHCLAYRPCGLPFPGDYPPSQLPRPPGPGLAHLPLLSCPPAHWPFPIPLAFQVSVALQPWQLLSPCMGSSPLPLTPPTLPSVSVQRSSVLGRLLLADHPHPQAEPHPIPVPQTHHRFPTWLCNDLLNTHLATRGQTQGRGWGMGWGGCLVLGCVLCTQHSA